MSDTPIGDQAGQFGQFGQADQAQAGQDAPPAPSPADGAPAPSAPLDPAPSDPGAAAGAPVQLADEPAPKQLAEPAERQVTDTSSPTLVRELETGRYGFVVGVRDVDYDVAGPPDAAGRATVEHVHFAELQVAWFDGHVGGCSADRVEAVKVAQG